MAKNDIIRERLGAVVNPRRAEISLLPLPTMHCRLGRGQLAGNTLAG